MSTVMPAERFLIKVKELGEQVKSTRTERGVTLAEAAAEIGLSASTLSRLENAKFTPKAKNLAQICEWLGASADRFMYLGSLPAAPPDTLSQVAVHLRADHKLSSTAADELIQMIERLYHLHVTESISKQP